MVRFTISIYGVNLVFKRKNLQSLDSNSLEAELCSLLESVEVLSKKRRLPEGLVIALLRDRFDKKEYGVVEHKHLRDYYKKYGADSYSGRTPTWVKLVVSMLSKEDEDERLELTNLS